MEIFSAKLFLSLTMNESLFLSLQYQFWNIHTESSHRLIAIRFVIFFLSNLMILYPQRASLQVEQGQNLDQESSVIARGHVQLVMHLWNVHPLPISWQGCTLLPTISLLGVDKFNRLKTCNVTESKQSEKSQLRKRLTIK